MEAISRKIVYITENTDITFIISEIDNKNIEHKDILVITAADVSDEYKQFVRNDLYCIGILTDKGSVQGIIVVDKIVGDYFCIQSNCVVLNCYRYEKLSQEPVAIKKTYSDIFWLLPLHSLGSITFGSDGMIAFQSSVAGLLSSLDQLTHEHATTKTECIAVAETFTRKLRILPDQDTLVELQNHVVRLLQQNIEYDQKVHLITVIADGLERNAMEEFSEKTNVYELIRTLELKGILHAAFQKLDVEKN